MSVYQKYLQGIILIALIISVLVPCLSILPILIIDFYLVWLLISAAMLSAGKVKDRDALLKTFPTRVMGLILFFVFFMISVYEFSNLYLANGQGFKEPLLCRLDAICLSFGTMTTVSIVNFMPTEPGTKILMMFQVFSTILLFFAAFPLLLSRISDFEDKLSKSAEKAETDAAS